MECEYFHVTPSSHRPGDRIRKGTYLSDAKEDRAYGADDPIQEFLRERVRKDHFPLKPSRFNSSFVFEKLLDAKFFRDELHPDRHIYIVRFDDPCAPRHRVCYTAWRSDYDDLEQKAYEYWDCPSNYSSGSEIFSESDLIVVAEVTTLAADTPREPAQAEKGCPNSY